MDCTGLYDEIFEPLRNRRADRPFVIAQIGQSLDGRIATPAGDSNNVSGDAGLDHLHQLRARSDIVVVGAGTASADDPQLTVRRVEGRNPARAVIDPSGRLSGNFRWLQDDGSKRLLITTSGNLAGCDETLRLPSTNGAIASQQIVDALFARGFGVILIEGGPATLSNFLVAGCVDRLHVCISPLIIGSGQTGIDLPPIAALSEARRPPARIFQLGDCEILFDCDMRAAE